MTSSRPYLIRAIYQWIVDSDLTPYLLVDAAQEGVSVPAEFVENNKIILNISPSAAQGLVLANEQVSFSARFAGKAREIVLPVGAILAIYAKENGQGMMFAEDDELDPPPRMSDGSAGGGRGTARRPSLQVVK